MHRFILIQLILAILILGCANAPTPRQTIEQDVQAVVDRYTQAVKAHRADEVYTLMSDAWRRQFAPGEFKSFFEQNYDLFVEYGELLRAESPLTIQAIFEGDPCGHTAWQVDADGQWKMAAVPDVMPQSDEMKSRMATLVRSREFMEGLDAYSTVHPEWSGETLRHLKRVIMFEELPPENIEFLAHEAHITFSHTAVIRLACGSDGWSIVQCNSIP